MGLLLLRGLRFRVWGLGFGVWGLGFGGWGLGFRAYSVSEFSVQGSGLRAGKFEGLWLWGL